MRSSRILPAALLTLALVAGCSSEGGSAGPQKPDGPAKARIDIDPEAYFDDYQSPVTEEDSTYSATPTGATPTTTQGPDPIPPTIDEDNTFVDPGEGAFVDTADERTSTFGLDVDTGSFSVGRTFLTEGQRPPTDSVRVEEWVNALGSDQAGPESGDLGVSIEGSRAPFAEDDVRLVRVGVAANDISAEDRPSANLTFVIDTSGSMDVRERLGLVKASLGLLVLNLRDDDKISIVTYSDDAGVVLEPTPVSDAQTIVDAIESLEPGNSTNLEAGLESGYAQADKAFDPDAVNAVILASDGVANVGSTDPDGLAATIQDRAEDGLHLITVGYGMGNYNDDLMEQLADRGDGFYSYLDTYEQARRLFEDRLTSTLTVVASDVKAQVTFDPTQVSSYRLIGYENRALDNEDFDDDTVDAGELGAGHRVTVLYEVKMADIAEAPLAAPDGPEDLVAITDVEPVEIATVSVKYRSSASGQIVPLEQSITSADIAGAFEDSTPAFRFQAATAAFAQYLAEDSVSIERGTELDTIESVALAASNELSEDGLPGSVVTPLEMLDLMKLAETASDPVDPTFYD